MRFLFLFLFRNLCGRRDSNPHASRRQILSLVRLPISPRPLKKIPKMSVSINNFKNLEWPKVNLRKEIANNSGLFLTVNFARQTQAICTESLELMKQKISHS